jgi:hypothetical protein
MTPENAAAELLLKIGKRSPHFLTPLPGGRNNTVWRVDTGQDSYLLKKYFWSESDPRNRLGQEWAFLEYLQSIHSRKAPAPLAKISEQRFALLEFISGKSPEEITESDILNAAVFFADINSSRHLARHLPCVSEAAFSLDAHLATAALRIDHLAKIEPTTPDHSAAVEFINSTLQPLWKKIRERLERIPPATRAAVLSPDSRCLSPSDFGFHNALRQSDGTLCYLDFEYAGWDDPAKTLIDFTNQPDRILPEPLAALFLEKTIPLFSDSADLKSRMAILTPVYQIKWACICLNAFLPGRTADPTRPLEAQLIRSRAMSHLAMQSLKPHD